MRSPSFPSRSGSALVIVLILLVLAGGGGWWYWNKHRQNTVTYQTVPVTRGDVTQVVTATGTLNPVINVQVGSQISGIIEKLFADFNSPVKAGQVVAQIDPSTYQATVMQAEGELANAKAALALARINEKRARDLDARKAAPQASLDQAVAALQQAEAQVKIREGSLQRAKVDLERCTIYSPVDGIVISRSVDVGQTVAASLSAPVIFTIANDLAKMQINSNVAEADVGNVAEGQDVEFTVDAYPYRTFHGKIVQVRNAPITVQNVVSYDSIISVNNDGLKLKPGMTANASIIVSRRENVLRVGGAALRFRLPEASPTPAKGPETTASPAREARAGGPGGGGGRGGRGGRRRGGGPKPERQTERTVYVLREGKPVAVKIKTGITDGINTEVLEGLEEGEPVITGMTGGDAPAAAESAATNPFMPQRGMRRH